MKKIIALLAFLLPAVSFAVTEPVACTMDVKLCSDGVTYVGRTGPSCSFAPCPGEINPPICTNLKFDLDIGATDVSTQGEVSLVQNFLYPQYLKVKPTGSFYGLTRAAVIQFQKDNGIFPARGYIGSLTRAKLQELICGGASQGVKITKVDPKSAKVGETVSLSGAGLNTGGDYILFNGYRIETDGSKVGNKISFKVPETLSKTIYCFTTPCPQPAAIKVTPGTYSIQVVNNKGSSNTTTLLVTDGTVVPNEKISISFVEPRSAKVGQSVVIYGYNLFRPETRILLDGFSIKGTPVYNKRLGDFNSALEFTVPSYFPSCNGIVCLAGLGRKVTPGGYELAVDNKYGRDSVKFEVLGDVIGGKPYLSYSNPTQGVVGTEVFVFGENLNAGSEKVYFGGSQVFPLTSATTDRKGMVRFKIPEYITPCGYEDGTVCRMMAQLVTPGKYDIVVKNKDGVSNTLSFTVVKETMGFPAITSISPNQGGVETSVNITGNYFSSNSTSVEFYSLDGVLKGNVYPSVVSATNIKFILNGFFANKTPITPGTYKVGVLTNNCAGGCSSNKVNFTFTGQTTNPRPEILSLSPSTGALGTEVVILGTWFGDNSDAVYFGGSLVSSKLISDGTIGKISFRVPEFITPCGVGNQNLCKIASVPVIPGKYEVVIVNKNGVSNTASFEVLGIVPSPQRPILETMTPVSVSVGENVRITGTNINIGDDRVYFSGTLVPRTDSIDLVNSLSFAVPKTYQACPVGTDCKMMSQDVVPGTYPITVINKFGQSNSLQLTIKK